MTHPDTAASVRHVSAPFRTYAGPRSLAALAKELDRSGAERVVLVCGASMAAEGTVVEAVERAIGSRLAGHFDDAQANSPLPSVAKAAALLTETQADAVVALGGGSAVVTARAATILAAEGKPARELCTRREAGRLLSPRLAAPKIAQWIVPTTPTTAYAKAGAAVRDPDSGDRLALFDPKARAAGVFMHPDAAATAPRTLVRSSALNAFAMCVDGLQSGVDDPLAEAQLRQALIMLRRWLPLVTESVDGDVGVRLMLAALLAGQASDHVGTGLAQPISHALGPRSSVGNGVIEAIMVPHVMDFNRGYTDHGTTVVAEALAPASTPSPATGAAAVREFLAEADVPARLRDSGIDESDLAPAIDHILDDWATTTVPRPVDRDGLAELLQAAW